MDHISERPQLDTIGYAVTAEQMKKVITESLKNCDRFNGSDSSSPCYEKDSSFTAAICPHDDFIYAGRLYHRVLSRIHARRVILFGVSHQARRFQIADTLVFENFHQWFSPTGPIAISDIRDQLLGTLHPGNFQVHNELHAKEHSLEGIAFYLKVLNPEVEILPVIVPAMPWERLKSLSHDFGSVLGDLMQEKNWIPGRDVAFICSNDGVHYGDVQWGGLGYAPFGTDLAGYISAVNQDRTIMKETLQGEMSEKRLKEFYYRCTDSDDFLKYRVTWCGRFAVTFGLLSVSHICAALLNRPLRDILDDYGTSVSEAHLTLNPDGPAATAPAHFRHFVGYPAVGYQ